MNKDTVNLEIRPYAPSDQESVVRLWIDCGLVVPWNNPRRDIRRKLKVQAEGFLIALADGQLIASVMAGYDGHRGWINYLAVNPRYRNRGIGRRMMEAAEAFLQNRVVPKSICRSEALIPMSLNSTTGSALKKMMS